MRIAVVGSGFAGSILARVLQIQGHRVLLLDRGRHPRFALGESSTPLAALCLERLAARYGLDDLHALAAYGRWTAKLPHLRRGLKRGFTFYGHEKGHRLLVAASPDDAVADTHWFRADVDHHLAQRAAAAGVEVLEEVELTAVERDSGWRLAGPSLHWDVDLVVDASGPGGFLARHLPIPSATTALHTLLVYGHFDGVDFPETAGDAPYPEERAAVHHLLEEGWMYVLPFDHGTVSAGFVVARAAERDALAALPPGQAWRALLTRYPTLSEQFAAARPTRLPGMVPRLQHRLAAAAGEGWALLPHAFCFLSPLFSTGIAWSLLAVERLALLLEPPATGLPAGLARYGALLAGEADHLERLLTGAYTALRDFDLFAAYSFLYFAAASFTEARQRLLPEGASWAWEGFLGSTDPPLGAALDAALALLRQMPDKPSDPMRERFGEEIRRAIAPRNVAGLAVPGRRVYPVDLEPLIRNAHLLGLTPEEVRREVPRLRGETSAD